MNFYFWKVDKYLNIYIQKLGLRPAALAFKNRRPGQKPPQAKHKGLAWPGFQPQAGTSLHMCRSHDILITSYWDIEITTLALVLSPASKSLALRIIHIPRGYGPRELIIKPRNHTIQLSTNFSWYFRDSHIQVLLHLTLRHLYCFAYLPPNSARNQQLFSSNDE